VKFFLQMFYHCLY